MTTRVVHSEASKGIPRLGLRANLAQFSLLVLVNAFVGAMVGLERTILPEIAEKEFGLAAKTAILSFIVVFVRSGPEYADGHIVGALHLPLDELPTSATSLPKNAVVVTVCNKGGGRSEKAAELLRSQGWKSARWLCGGCFGWIEAGLPDYEAGPASS